MLSSTKVLNTYKVAARQIDSGALKLSGCCGLVPAKSTIAERASRSTVTLTLTTAPLSSS